jgi:hypothetical protein
MHTPGACGVGKNRPRRISRATSLCPWTPGPMTARISSASISIESRRDRSISRPPSRRWFCAQLWPPDTTLIFMPSRPAFFTAAMTSNTSFAWTRMSGRTPGSRAL